MIRQLRILVVALLLPGLGLLPACSQVTNPATGEREYTAMSPAQEAEIGAEQHPLILQQFGGEYPDPELQAYVDEVGSRLAAASELPDLDFTFTLLNSDVANAFALPGGYVYITRGILTLAENEAEVAGVLGHEIGHVTGRHSAQRQTQAQTAGILGTLGTVAAAILFGQTGAELAQQAAGIGAQAYVASYSRDQELEADTLGIRYLKGAGYDPTAMATFLEKLDALSGLERAIAGQEGDPASSWFATHPRTLDRVEDAIAAVEGGADGRIARQAHLARIDGMVYGPDPSQGFVEGDTFVHPELGFAFEPPPGFQIQNTPSAVLGKDREGRLMIFTLARTEGRDLTSYVAGPGLREIAQQFQAEVSAPRGVQTFRVNGLPAASASATLRKNGGTGDIGLAAVDAGSAAYRFVFLTSGNMSREAARAFQQTVQSFRTLSREEAAAYQPRRIQVVRAEGGRDVDAYVRRMDVEAAPAERFQVLNRLALQDGLSPGEEIKLIVR
ncbi:MAG TPA: M48 family metalloprotease [Geminicoccaceae bacterium]